MRLLSAIGISVLALAIVVPAYAQDKPDQKEEEKDKPAKEKEKKEEPSKPMKEEDRKAEPEKKNIQEEKTTQQQEKKNQQEQRDTQQQTRNNQEQKNVQRGRIPEDRYRAHFGREHTFRVSQGDFRSGRFQYGGYWFGFGGEWPSNWLYTQDVYVIEINGVYYLCNPAYPGVNLLINVTL
jgi:hypothetical protein